MSRCPAGPASSGSRRTSARWTRSSAGRRAPWRAPRCSPCWSGRSSPSSRAARSLGPLTDITAAARAIAAGSPPRFPRSGVPDIDVLVQALRQMHRQLGDRFDELRREQAEIGGAGRVHGGGGDRRGRAGPDRHRQSGRAPAAGLRPARPAARPRRALPGEGGARGGGRRARRRAGAGPPARAWTGARSCSTPARSRRAARCW